MDYAVQDASFCNESILRTPYIKIYQSRESAMKTGRPLTTFGPGFHDEFATADLENVLICLNGL